MAEPNLNMKIIVLGGGSFGTAIAHQLSFNTNNFVYGLSGYIGVGDFSVYAKYNLNTLFKNQDVDQRNVSLGLRWAMD